MKRTNFSRKAATLCCIMAAMMYFAVPAHATGLTESPVFKGTFSLITDVTNWLILLCPAIGGLAALYCVIRRSMADTQDGKMWTNRIWIAIACGVGGSLISGLISIVAGYFV